MNWIIIIILLLLLLLSEKHCTDWEPPTLNIGTPTLLTHFMVLDLHRLVATTMLDLTRMGTVMIIFAVISTILWLSENTPKPSWTWSRGFLCSEIHWASQLSPWKQLQERQGRSTVYQMQEVSNGSKWSRESNVCLEFWRNLTSDGNWWLSQARWIGNHGRWRPSKISKAHGNIGLGGNYLANWFGSLNIIALLIHSVSLERTWKPSPPFIRISKEAT